MTDLSAGNLLSPIERARLSAELLQVRERLNAGLSPIEQVRASTRGLELRALLGTPAAAPGPEPTVDPLLTELEAAEADVAQHERHMNMGVLTPKAMAAIDRHIAARSAVMAREKSQAIEAALLRPIGTANSKPHTISTTDALTPAGAIKSDAKNSKADSAIWYYQGDIQQLAFTAKVTINGEKSPGAARAAATLERLQAAQTQGYKRRNYRAGSLGTVWVLESADGKSFLTRAGFEELVNPIFARPDMPADAPGYETMLARQTALAKAFISWLDTLSYEQRHNQGVVTRKIGSTAIGRWMRMEKDIGGLMIQHVGEDGQRGARIAGADFEGMVATARDLAMMPEVIDAQTGLTAAGAAQGEEQSPATGEDTAPTSASQPEIIEYTTKRDKVLRGIIRTDLTHAEAKAIDPYTWKLNGGYFIREKHLDANTAHIPAAAAPVVLSAEQQAEQQATAERHTAERRQQALAAQVQKLRAVADKAVASGDAGMNADRNTNTARRAGMAASAIGKAAADKAAGQTLNNIADAIEVGSAGLLAKLSSRAQLEELQRLMRRAQFETDKGLSYTEQMSRKGRPFSDDDIRNLEFPRPTAWSNRYKAAALTMAKKSAAGNSRLIAALTKIGAGPERIYLDEEKAAITRKANTVLKAVRESWDLSEPMEALAVADRLARMGVTDITTLQEAVRELLPHLAERAEEDPIRKAERAIIGQKVGIDFFPTPAHLAQRMARLAGVTEGMRVLEPSAGNGNLADAAKAAGGVVDVIEISSQLRDILTAKGYNVVATDFDGFSPDEPYPAIIMNPPFSKRQDAAHIMKAFTMLAGGGHLVAIAGEGVFFGQDQKAQAFRDWLDAHGATVEALEGGTFKDNALLAQTSVNARLIIIKK